MKKLLILSLLALGYQSASAQLVTESFGSGANAFTMDFAAINSPEISVPYVYNIGMYEISRAMIDKANFANDLRITMYDMANRGGNSDNKPAVGITWHEAAKFVNWLNTSTGNPLAYKVDQSGNFEMWSPSDLGFNSQNRFRNSLAKFFIPSSQEWYKAAYGSPSGQFYFYPTGSDSAPTPVSSGTNPGTAVYGQPIAFGPADINNAGGLSAFGVMAMGGNVYEWTESAYDGSNDNIGENRILRGGAWYTGSWELGASDYYSARVDGDGVYWGFRVASVPEPSSLSLLALGGVVVALRRRR